MVVGIGDVDSIGGEGVLLLLAGGVGNNTFGFEFLVAAEQAVGGVGLMVVRAFVEGVRFGWVGDEFERGVVIIGV